MANGSRAHVNFALPTRHRHRSRARLCISVWGQRRRRARFCACCQVQRVPRPSVLAFMPRSTWREAIRSVFAGRGRKCSYATFWSLYAVPRVEKRSVLYLLPGAASVHALRFGVCAQVHVERNDPFCACCPWQQVFNSSALSLSPWAESIADVGFVGQCRCQQGQRCGLVLRRGGSQCAMPGF